MPQPLRMHQIKRLIELHLQGRSIRQLNKLTGISRNTVRDYLRKLLQCGRSLADLLAVDDAELLSMVQTEEPSNNAGRLIDHRFDSIKHRLDYYCSELSRRGVTRSLLWEEYKRDHPDGYGYSQFCEHLSRHLKRDSAVMHFTHKPGEVMQVDFAGGKLGYVDPNSGEWMSCEVLICVLPFSHFIYAEALRSQRQEDFIKGFGNALTYIGGVPGCIKCDNMRIAVTKAHRYEPVFAEAMEFLAAHYGTTILTARVRKPRDKPSVEKGVDVAYKRLYAPLRDQVFTSIEQLNASLRKQLEALNNQPFKAREGTRRQQFDEFERPLLKPLPTSLYLIRNVTEATVQRNYHVIVGQDRHQYSVPYTLIGKRLKVIYTTDTVDIYDGLTRVALHSRSYQKYGYTTLADHMPERHKHVVDQQGWNAEDFEKHASYVGPATLKVIQRVLQSRSFYAQTYNTCLGILRLKKKYSKERLENACQRIQDAPTVNYRMVENVLKNHLDKSATDTIHNPPAHRQIRGPQSYQ